MVGRPFHVASVKNLYILFIKKFLPAVPKIVPTELVGHISSDRDIGFVIGAAVVAVKGDKCHRSVLRP
jgi:hypothetical protein